MPLSALRRSTAALIRGIDAEPWTDEGVREPSLLPNWTRGHVLTHIARNADGITRATSGALRGELVRRYPNGPAGRDADIEAGAGRSMAELAADVRDSAARLDRVLDAVAAIDGWDLPTDDGSAGRYVLARWREVEIHRVDLAGAYTAEQWPADFVGYLLPEVIGDQAARASTSLRITVTPERSVVTDLAGRVWTVGDGEHVDVAGPDWALLAWLVGRPNAASDALDPAPPAIPAWR